MAVSVLNLYGFDYYTCDVDTSRGYECYDFRIEANGATYLVTINGYTGFVEGEGTVLRPGDDVRAVTLMGESEALDKALDAFGLAKFDCYTCDVDTSRGYECYDFAIEADGATWLVTINGYNGFVEK